MVKHYIALDVSCTFCEAAVVTGNGRLTRRDRCDTTIPALVEFLESVPRPRYLTFEEGAMADWLYRNLSPHTDETLVCEPRRNRLISEEGDKDDPLDAWKLAGLYRGGYLKAVHHPESLERMVLKQRVALYHDEVRQRVRQANRVIAFVRRHGVVVQESAFADSEDRPALLRRLPPSKLLREDVELLWQGYDAAIAQETEMERRVVEEAKGNETVRRFQELPGYGWIRSATFYVYVDTPWRFARKSDLWKYVGIGLQRRHSGDGPMHLRVAQRANKRLKCTVLGGALSAILAGENPFAKLYQRWTQEEGIAVPNARRNVARSQVATLWGMWKNGSVYHPEWVARARLIGAACGGVEVTSDESGVRRSSGGQHEPGLRAGSSGK